VPKIEYDMCVRAVWCGSERWARVGTFSLAVIRRLWDARPSVQSVPSPKDRMAQQRSKQRINSALLRSTSLFVLGNVALRV